MLNITEEKRIEFEVNDKDKVNGIYPLFAIRRGNDVFVTIAAPSAEICNSYPTKKAAYSTRTHEKIAMTNAGIETQGAAVPCMPDGSPIRTEDIGKLTEGMHYRRTFRLTPAL